MKRVNPKNTRRWINSYFDSPHTIHLSIGAAVAVGMWIVGALDVGFGAPPQWVFVATFFAAGGLSYTVDATLTTLYEWYSQ